MKNTQAILFDLDGTLLDTAHDLGESLNNLLRAHHYPEIPLAQSRAAAGSGCKGLIKLGMNIDAHDTRYPTLRAELLAHYQINLLNHLTFFPGMEKTLAFLEEKNISWGIVTNKPGKYTDQIVMHLALDKRAACIISGDSLPHCKPHPDPLLHACRLLKQRPQDCLYIGDSEIDVLASKAAGMPVLTALYGYIPTDEKPETWGAHGYIKQPEDILLFL